MTTIQSLIDKYSSRSERLTPISADEVLIDLKGIQNNHIVIEGGMVKSVTITTPLLYHPVTPQEKAKFLVNECYYQPLTLQLNVNNNSDQMWKYAKRCVVILVNEILGLKMIANMDCAPNKPANEEKYWEQVMEEVRKL